MSETADRAAKLVLDPPDRRERCAACGAMFDESNREVVRELGGEDRAWHFGCYLLVNHDG